MPEFYKYAERQAGSQVNWAGLGVDMAETLNAEEKIREDKRVAIDEATNKTIDEINRLPRGEEPNGNKIITDYADNMTQALLMQHKLMKSGRLNPKDYMLFNANAKSGTSQMFNLQTEYQKQYSATMDRIKKGESQDAEVDLRAYYETFADLTKVKPVIDPKTGQVNLAIMEYDKNNVLQPTGKTTSVQAAFKGLSQKFDKFDVMGASKKISDSLGNVVITTLKEGSISESGQVITLDYALQKPEMQKALDGYTESYLSNPYNTSSILTNDLGTYENVFSRDGSEKSSGNKIAWHIGDNGEWKPEFTKEQESAAKEYLKNKAIAQISEKEEIKQFESSQADMYKFRVQEQKDRTQNRALDIRERALSLKEGGGTDGTEWETYVGARVPIIGKGGTADETLIKELNTKLPGLDLTFKQEEGTKRESVVIVDNEYENATPYVIDLKNPDARQQIIDYILVKRADKGKDLIGTGVLNKNVKNTGKVYGGVGADGKIIWK